LATAQGQQEKKSPENTLAGAQKANLDSKCMAFEVAFSGFNKLVATHDSRSESNATMQMTRVAPQLNLLKEHVVQFEKVVKMTKDYCDLCLR